MAPLRDHSVVHGECPVCGRGVMEIFLCIDGVPVITTELWPDHDAAVGAARGDLQLGFCATCGLIRNLAFDASLVTYTAAYENSQHFSAAFASYARDLARHLVRTYGLSDGVVVEIGSGKGEFLALLCEEGAALGVGFDPSYDGEVDDRFPRDRLRIMRDDYGQDHVDLDAELVCCRHVLEHIDDPVRLLCELRRTIGDRSTALYFEVPNGDFVLSPAGQWDLIYPHVSYFTEPSMRHLFERCGFEVLDLRPTFDGQFLAVEARPAQGFHASRPPEPAAVAALGERVRSFASSYEATLKDWKALFASGEGEIALWGAGAKGVAFLNATSAGDGVAVVVDLNRRKRGSYLPGSGHRVMEPSDLADRRVDTVLVMNALYEGEIRAQLADMGLHPEVISV